MIVIFLPSYRHVKFISVCLLLAFCNVIVYFRMALNS